MNKKELIGKLTILSVYAESLMQKYGIGGPYNNRLTPRHYDYETMDKHLQIAREIAKANILPVKDNQVLIEYEGLKAKIGITDIKDTLKLVKTHLHEPGEMIDTRIYPKLSSLANAFKNAKLNRMPKLQAA